MRYVNKIKQATLPDRSQGVFEPQAREVFDGEATPSDFDRSLHAVTDKHRLARK